MTINLNDCESMEINARYSAEGIDKEYAYIGKKYGPFGVAWKLVRQCVQANAPESRDTLTWVNIFTIKLWSVKTEGIPFSATSF